MRVVSNPSYKHSKEIIEKFNRLKDNIFNKDHSTYNTEYIKEFLNAVTLCKNMGLKADSTKWITKEMFNLKLTEKDVSEDYIPVLLGYQKYKNNGLKPLSMYVSIVELNYAIQEIVGETSESISSDEFGIIDEHNGWLLTMPYTVEASCSLGSNTVWCTARRDGENKFLSYIKKDRYILFYAIKTDSTRSDEYSKISIGFKNGKLVPGDSAYSATVTSQNNKLTEKDLKKVFGEKLWARFLSKMKAKLKSINNIHPIFSEIVKAGESIGNFLASNKKLQEEVLSFGEFSNEVAEYLILNDGPLDLCVRRITDKHSFSRCFNYLSSIGNNSEFKMAFSKNVPEHFRKEITIYYLSKDLSRLIMSINDLDFLERIEEYIPVFVEDEREDLRKTELEQNIGYIVNRALFLMKDSVAEELLPKHENKLIDFALKYSKSQKGIFDYILNDTSSQETIDRLYSLFSSGEIKIKIDSFSKRNLPQDVIRALLSKENDDRLYNLSKLIEDGFSNYPLFKEMFNDDYNDYGFIGRYSISDFIVKNDPNLEIKIKYFCFSRESHTPFEEYFTNDQIMCLLKNNVHLKLENKKELYVLLATRFPGLANREFLIESLLYCLIQRHFSDQMLVRNIDDEAQHEIIIKLYNSFKESRYADHELGSRLYLYLQNINISKKILQFLLNDKYLKPLVSKYTIPTEDAIEYVFDNLSYFAKQQTIYLDMLTNSPFFSVSFLFRMSKWERENICVYDNGIEFARKDQNDFHSSLFFRSLVGLLSNKRISREEFERYVNYPIFSLKQIEIAKSKNINDLVKAASDENITKEIINILKKSKNKQVLDALLDNPNVLLSDLF